jgi:hypothetical protein
VSHGPSISAGARCGLGRSGKGVSGGCGEMDTTTCGASPRAGGEHDR